MLQASLVRCKAKLVTTQPKAQNAAETTQPPQDTTTLHHFVEELRSLPIGKEKDFYPQTLKEHGSTIANTQDTKNQTEFTLEKADQALRLTVQFDENTRTSVKVNASGARLAGEHAEKRGENI